MRALLHLKRKPMLSLLSNLPAWAGKIFESLKTLFSLWYLRRSTKIETERDVLEDVNKIKSEQLEISARPPSDPDDLRDRMRDNRL